jgi:putative PIN family toxin of toxin-antitoxin system
MSEQKLRVVLDLNILISAYFFSKPNSSPRRILEAALDEHFVMLHSPDYCTDLIKAFSKEKFVIRLAQINQTAQAIVDIIVDLGESVPAQAVPSDAVRDTDDVVILACAVGGNADYIVSGDQDLTVLNVYRDIAIITPAEFLAILYPPAGVVLDEPAKE